MRWGTEGYDKIVADAERNRRKKISDNKKDLEKKKQRSSKMRVTIRCKDAMVLKSEDGEIAVVLNDVNEDDISGAFSLIEINKSMIVEEIDKLVMPEIE